MLALGPQEQWSLLPPSQGLFLCCLSSQALDLVLCLPEFFPGWDGQEQPEQGLWGARAAPSKVPPAAARLRCDTKTQSAPLVYAFMGQAGERSFERGWFGPL